MMAFCGGVAVGLAVAAWYCTALMYQWNHAFIVYGATISRIHARWIITDFLGTFEGHATEHLIPLMHRYSATRSTPRSTTPDATEER